MTDHDNVPEWLDLTDEHTDEQWAAACEKVISDNEPTEEPGDPPIRANSITSCPLDPAWRHVDVFDPARRHDCIPPEAMRRVLEARRAPAGRNNPQTLDLVWELAVDDASVALLTDDTRSFDPGTPSHVHAECMVAAHHVHIDATAARLWGPGRSWLEIRIFVDGQLAGRGGSSGCSLGAGIGTDLPAVGRVGSTRLLVVDDARQAARRGFRATALRFRVELWQT